MIRRFGESVRPEISYRPRHGAYAVLRLGGDILVTHQNDPTPEFQLPGGGIDAGESPLRALHREVIEETGWTITGIRRLGAYRRFTYMPEYDKWAEKICAIYLARPVRALCSPRESGHTAVWMPIGTALRMLDNSGDRHFVRLVAQS